MAQCRSLADLMRPTHPRMRALAGQLLVLATENSDSESLGAFRVCERLRPVLASLVGVEGFRSLLSRALALSGDEVLWLKAVHVKSNGSLEGWDPAQVPAAKLAEGEAVLVTHLLDLLATFIGEGLTLRLVQEVWPEAIGAADKSENDTHG